MVHSASFAATTFDPKKFFEMVGMTAMSPESVKEVFRVLDVDGSGFIEEDELKWDTGTDTKTHKRGYRPAHQTASTPHPTHFLLFLSVTLRYVLKGFSKEGRDLTDDETKAFLKAADKDGDGKIGIDGERACVFIWQAVLSALWKHTDAFLAVMWLRFCSGGQQLARRMRWSPEQERKTPVVNCFAICSPFLPLASVFTDDLWITLSMHILIWVAWERSCFGDWMSAFRQP